MPELVRKRARHVVEEIARVDQAIECLNQQDARCFGKLMFAGHESLRDLYEVSIPELDLLVELAAGLPGCYGARLTGAGFGGCTVNLVAEDRAQEFQTELKQQYQQRTGRTSSVYLCRASRGVFVERL
jgi:galactokinase